MIGVVVVEDVLSTFGSSRVSEMLEI